MFFFLQLYSEQAWEAGHVLFSLLHSKVATTSSLELTEITELNNPNKTSNFVSAIFCLLQSSRQLASLDLSPSRPICHRDKKRLLLGPQD